MATINTAIERAMKMRPDAFDDSIKASWINELDGKISRETMHQNDFFPYIFPRDGDKELLAKSPYDNIYELYIIAMSAFFSGEMASYSSAAVLFGQAYSEFRKNYIRNNMPPQKTIRF
jgi:hypothetical protein